jgi:hypothetical protein
MNFTELMKYHTEKMLDNRYAAIECLIANYMLITGAKISEIVLVEKVDAEAQTTRYSIETDDEEKNKKFAKHKEENGQ